MKEQHKIFCIGLNKTGTSSLHEAFKILGVKSVHHICEEGYLQNIMIENHNNGDKLLSKIDHYEAFSDWTMTSTLSFFKILDVEYTESKFIFTSRDIDSWVKSRETHVKSMNGLKQLQKENPENTWINLRTDIWRKEFVEYETEVRSYFADREEDILFFDVTKGDGWGKLCAFLKTDQPKCPFPHKNKKKSYLQKQLKKIKKFLKHES